MQVRISHDSEPRLKIIPFIPDLRVCQLEGRNGIGKTLAVRLLELVSGRHPYLGLPQAWVSLKTSLKNAVITIDHLQGAETLVYRLTPESWPDDVVDGLNLDDIATVEIDGKPATMDAASKLVQVERLAGDETLAHTLANDIAVQQAELDPMVSALAETVATWQRRAASLLDGARPISPGALETSWSSLEECRRKHAEAMAHSEAATTAEWNLGRAESMRLRAAHNREALPQVEVHLTDARARLEQLATERSALDLELAALLAKRSRDNASRVEADRLTRLQRRRQTVLNNRHADVLAGRHRLGLTADPSHADLDQMAAEVRAQLQDAIRRSAELDVVGPLIELGAAVAGPLERAVDQGMGSQPVADLDRPIAAAELLAGVDRRRHALAGQPRPGQLDLVKAEIAEHRARQTQITTLQSALRARDRAQELVDEVNEQLADPQFAPSAQAKQAVAEIRDRQHDTHRQLVEAEVEVRRFAEELERLRAEDPDDLDAKALEAEELVSGLVGDPSAAAIAEMVKQSAAATMKAEVDLQAASDRLQGLRSSLSALVHELGSDPELAWLRPGWVSLSRPSTARRRAKDPSDGPSSEELKQAAYVERLVRVVSAFADRAVAVRNDTSAAFDYLTILQGAALQRARGGQSAAPRSYEQAEVAGRVRAFLASRYSEQFSQPALLEALFDHAPAVHLDLADYRLSWDGPDGVERHRPLEAFSSGEQAFAYTLARLEIVAARNRTAANLMVVLDEFGAFVARDRLAELLKAVHGTADKFIEQVVVILPLADDYASAPELPAGVGGELSERARQVRDRGYFALTPTTV